MENPRADKEFGLASSRIDLQEKVQATTGATRNTNQSGYHAYRKWDKIQNRILLTPKY